MNNYYKNIAVCTTVLQAFIKSSSIVVQPDSQSGISLYVFVCGVFWGVKILKCTCQKAFYCGVWGVFFRSIVNRFPGLSNAFVVGVTLVW